MPVAALDVPGNRGIPAAYGRLRCAAHALAAGSAPSHWQSGIRSPFIGLAIGVTVLTVLGGAAGTMTGPARAAVPSASDTSALAAPSPTPSPTLSASPAPGWAPVQLEPVPVVAELTAMSTDRAGVATDSTFVLTSRTTERADAMAARLQVEPAVELRVEPGAATAVLHPVTPLAKGRIYRLTLQVPDGTLQASWVFQTKQSLHVASTLPSNRATGVPLHAGIEVTFDQDGTTEGSSYFGISPQVAGRFEQHGRTLLFVPQKLDEKTVYTVTIRKGLPLDDTDQVLQDDAIFSFETAAPEAARPPVHPVEFTSRIFETSTKEPAVLTVVDTWGQKQKAAPEVAAVVYRFPSLATCLAAIRTVEAVPDWTEWQGGQRLVPTSTLERVAGFKARLELLGPDSYRRWFGLPAKLPAGWYLVSTSADGTESQAFLQVTDLATYVATTSTRSVFWVHDLATGAPMTGAAVELETSGELGRTDAEGLLVIPTPPEVHRTEPAFIVRAPDERAAFILGSMWGAGRQSWGWEVRQGDAPVQDSWTLFYTDRGSYRQTDSVSAWGFVRERDTGRVPTDLSVRLVAGDSYDQQQATPPPIVDLEPTADAVGAFAFELPLRDLPFGWYELQLWSGETRLAARGFSVEVIRKPAYRLSIEADRNFYIAGDRIRATISASFYDGTPVPGVEIDTSLGRTATTDALGRTRVGYIAAIEDESQEATSWVSAYPAHGEEALIRAGTSVLVYAGSLYLDGAAKLAGKRLTVSGAAHHVDLDRAEATAAAGLPADPRGTAARGQRVSLKIVRHIHTVVRTPAGQSYDFIAKRVVQLYDYDYRTTDVLLAAPVLTAIADGSFGFVLQVPDPKGDYTVTIAASDRQGRTSTIQPWVEGPPLPEIARDRRPHLGVDGPAGAVRERDEGCWDCYRIGEAVRVVMEDGDGPLPSGGPNEYLFLTEQRGLRTVTVTATPHFAVTYDDTAPPTLSITAVRFTGRTYQAVPDGFAASFAVDQRRLHVAITPDAARYRPGETVTLDVTTTRAEGGRPVAATVIVTAVDQKLWDMGVASEQDALGGLYESVTSGLEISYASHQYPSETADGCDACGGGGGSEVRTDWRDVVVHRQVTTDASGRAQVVFGLSDDLTSWHVSAQAVSSELEAGSSWVGIPVGLPFFADAMLAPDYLVGDQPFIRLRAYGEALQPGTEVLFVVSSSTLGMAPQTVQAAAFGDVQVPLPSLHEGTHEILIEAKAVTPTGTELRDSLVRTFEVVRSRLVRDESTTEDLGAGFRPAGGPGFTSYVFGDAGRGRFLATLRRLAWGDGPRLDQALAAAGAQELLEQYFPDVEVEAPTASFSPEPYARDSGLSLLPYASPDLELSVQAAMAAPAALAGAGLAGYLRDVLGDERSTAERRALALAGLAALGEPVLEQLRTAAAAPGAFPMTRLYLALGLEAVGDDATALAIERDVLARFGERYGELVRLRVSERPSDISEATALLAVAAAGVGDPIADAAERYVESNPSSETLLDLQQLAYVKRAISRAPAASASFAYTMDGNRKTVTLGPGKTFSLRLTPSQRAGFSAETLTGRVAVTTSWQAPLDIAGSAVDPQLNVARDVAPSGVLESGQVVRVTFRVSFQGPTPYGCYRLTETVPSGLVPLEDWWDWPDWTELSWPYLVQGQRVEWCVWPGDEYPPGYFARVASGGTFTWEPAVLQPAIAAERMALTPTAQITVR